LESAAQIVITSESLCSDTELESEPHIAAQEISHCALVSSEEVGFEEMKDVLKKFTPQVQMFREVLGERLHSIGLEFKLSKSAMGAVLSGISKLSQSFFAVPLCPPSLYYLEKEFDEYWDKYVEKRIICWECGTCYFIPICA
jgi:hypothetical protein